MNLFGQPIPVRNEAGEVVGERIPVVSRLTKNELGGCHGMDKARRLVVSLRAGDIVAFRPEGTRREVTATAHDLYSAVLRWQVNRLNLVKAGEAKKKKAEQRINARIANADRRLRAQLKAEASK